MHLSKRSLTLIALALALAGSPSCGDREGSPAAGAANLDRTAWLGSAEGWGLLGFPLDGGPLTYRSAETLESPTWAPPELEQLTQAWPGERAVWLQLSDSRIARYEYRTGHLLGFEGFEGTETAAALGRRGLLMTPDPSSLELVSEGEPWQLTLEGSVQRLVPDGEERVVVVVDAGSGNELLVVEPPVEEPVGRRSVAGVGDLVLAPAGDRLYYLTRDGSDLRLHGLSVPELEDAEELDLPQPGRAVAVTPSGHRLYVSAGDSLHVFDRVRATKVRSVPLPGAAIALRFSKNGTHLMALLDTQDQAIVLQVGIDSILGSVPLGWDENLPVAVPGGRLIALEGDELVLYDVLRLVEVARAELDERRLWLAVEWRPPRPRMELAQRTVRRASETVVAEPQVGAEAAEPRDPDAGAEPGVYAVVSAARERAGVDNLVSWLRSVGYPGTVDRHEDVMGVVWYRAMVGPYPERELAEEAARSLTARYGYKPWILTVTESADTTAGLDESDRPGENEGAGAAAEAEAEGG
ncbi:MAG: SPOR domain-containing protein [Gemmatimonadota bacterium]|nr:MAG: SPOR domain-containing protein [Gemmatimonadota bacterium]